MTYLQTNANFPITSKIFSSKYIPQSNDSWLNTLQKIAILSLSIIGIFTLAVDLCYSFKASHCSIAPPHQHTPIRSLHTVSQVSTRRENNFWTTNKKIFVGVLGGAALCALVYLTWVYLPLTPIPAMPAILQNNLQKNLPSTSVMLYQRPPLLLPTCHTPLVSTCPLSEAVNFSSLLPNTCQKLIQKSLAICQATKSILTSNLTCPNPVSQLPVPFPLNPSNSTIKNTLTVETSSLGGRLITNVSDMGWEIAKTTVGFGWKSIKSVSGLIYKAATGLPKTTANYGWKATKTAVRLVYKTVTFSQSSYYQPVMFLVRPILTVLILISQKDAVISKFPWTQGFYNHKIIQLLQNLYVRYAQ